MSIETLYNKRDLDGLRELAKPSKRKLNKMLDFKSSLMLSCNNLKHLMKIENIKADAIILNLEDGVSKEDKPFALVLCAIFLSKLKECDKKLIVRVNSLEDGGLDEIKYLNSFKPDAIRVPKIETRDDIVSILDILDEEIELHLSVETSKGWKNLISLNVNDRVSVFYLGILDLFADIGLSQSIIDIENPTMHYMLSHFLITSKTIGVKPVSFVYQDYKNLDTFKKWLELEKMLGFDSKACISPKQVDLVNLIFKTEDDEISRAKYIVKIFEENRKNGITGFSDEKYGFIDEPIYKGALKVLMS